MKDLNIAIKGVQQPDAYVLRGILHKINHQYDRSLADYEKAIASIQTIPDRTAPRLICYLCVQCQNIATRKRP